MKSIVLSLLLLLILLCPISVRSQEVQIPLDRDGNIEVIDSDLGGKLGLFTTYDGFREARLYQISDTSYVLEITYQPADRTMKARLPLTVSAVGDLRDSVSLRITELAPQAALNHEGRTSLLVGSTTLSLGFYGWAVPVVLEMHDKTAVALYMLTSATGFFVPLAVTNSIDVTDANAILYNYGATRGIIHGVFLHNLLFDVDDAAKGSIAMGMLGSIGESIAGFAVASKMSAGTASTISVCGDFGIGIGLGTCGLLDLFQTEQERAVAATVLLGSAGGLIAGGLLASDQSYTRGDAFVLEGAGLLGSYVPLAALELLGVESGKTYIAASMLGSVAGIALAHGSLVRGKDFTTGQGVLIQLGTVGGALAGAGIAYLVSPRGNGDGTLFLTSSAIGAVGGFALTYTLFSKDLRKREASSSWRLHLLPGGFLTSRLMKNSPLSLSHAPVLTVEYRL